MVSNINPVLVGAIAYWVIMLGLAGGYFLTTKYLGPRRPDNTKVLIKGGLTCTICGADADVYLDRYQCQADPTHLAFKGDKVMFVGNIIPRVRHD